MGRYNKSLKRSQFNTPILRKSQRLYNTPPCLIDVLDLTSPNNNINNLSNSSDDDVIYLGHNQLSDSVLIISDEENSTIDISDLNTSTASLVFGPNNNNTDKSLNNVIDIDLISQRSASMTCEENCDIIVNVPNITDTDSARKQACVDCEKSKNRNVNVPIIPNNEPENSIVHNNQNNVANSDEDYCSIIEDNSRLPVAHKSDKWKCKCKIGIKKSEKRNALKIFDVFQENSRKFNYVRDQLLQLELNKYISTCRRPKEYSNFVYNANPVVKNGLRLIVIDGSNVAFGHSNNQYFSCEGLKICIDYFLNRNHKVKAFVPKYRNIRGNSSNPDLLNQLAESGHVVYTPSRYCLGRLIISHDDRFVLQCAAEYDAIVVSNDNYSDLILENQKWQHTIVNKILMYTWVGNMIMFQPDPLGKNGPSLDEFLAFP